MSGETGTTTPIYIVANIDISDPVAYKRYEAGFAPILLRHSGSIVGLSENAESLEGEPLHGRVIVACFPSKDAAKGWFNDPDYQAIAEHRRGASTARFVSLVEAVGASGDAQSS